MASVVNYYYRACCQQRLVRLTELRSCEYATLLRISREVLRNQPIPEVTRCSREDPFLRFLYQGQIASRLATLAFYRTNIG